MPLVEFPNGERVDFPDDMPEEEMHSAAASYWSGKQKGTISSGESFMHGAGNIAYGLSKMAARALPQEARGVMARPLGKIEENIKQRKIEYEARKPEGFDIAKMAGEIAATLPIAIAGGSGLAGGIAAGAIAGAASPETDDEDHYWQSKMVQAGIGAAGGVVGQVAGKLLSGAVNPAAKELVSEGVTPSLGQAIGPKTALAEEKLTSVPFLGGAIVRTRDRAIQTMNVAAYNRALLPIGQKASGEIGHEGVEEVRQHLSRAFDELAPKLTIAPNTLASDVAPIVEKAAQYLPEKEMNRLGEILDRARTKDNFKEAEEYLNHFATQYGRAPDPDMRSLGEHISNVLDAARNSLAEQNPAYASRLRAINEGWANYDVIRRAAGSQGSREGVFSPEQLNAAVRSHAIARGGQTKGLGQYAGGQALMQDLSRQAMKVLGKKYPDSGTPGRMMQAGNVAVLLGPLLGHPATLALPAAEALAAVPYASPLLRRTSAAAVLKRPSGAGAAALTAKIAGRVASPGVGLVLAEAGAP